MEFESEQAMHAWASHSDCDKAKAADKQQLTEYRIQICNIVRDSGVQVLI